MDAGLLGQISGGTELLAWFEGRAPSFHDSEVLGVMLDREGSRCSIRIHTFRMTPEVDSYGYYVCDKHVVVTITMDGVSSLELSGFNHQNALNQLTIERTSNEDFLIDLHPAFGLEGKITASNLSIDLNPGIPPDSVHLRRNRAVRRN